MTTPGRIVGIVVGALAILGIGVYGPAMLLGPLPEVSVHLEPTATASSEVPALTLPEGGASALAVLSDDGASETIAVAGDPAAVPIGGAAKLVTLLVTLDSLPLPAEGEGPAIPIGPEDYTDYLRYSGEGSRSLQVSPGETWTERDVVRAVLLASSNNHADTLVRWAFGGVQPYVDAANEWLAEAGFTSTRVDDATGLSGDNVGTADELARLAGLVLADPALAAMLDDPGRAPLGARTVPDVVARPGTESVRAITRSFTDQAGLSYVFTTELPAVEGDDGAPRRITGAMLLMPDYETLDPAVTAAVDSAVAASAPITVIAAGTPYASVVAPWGDRAELVASVSRADAAWGNAFGEASVTVERFSTASEGREVGRVTVESATGELAAPLQLSGDIRDPGPIWRLTNPLTLIGAFLDGRDS
jgi:serine-type D-Ala-D-Ala carboxypeptidase (penicillin-binding protein 5/6)